MSCVASCVRLVNLTRSEFDLNSAKIMTLKLGGKVLLNENDFESCVLLERVSNRKADSYVKLNVKMEDYYRIKDVEGGEADG